jgi:hypothetical protein
VTSFKVKDEAASAAVPHLDDSQLHFKRS